MLIIFVIIFAVLVLLAFMSFRTLNFTKNYTPITTHPEPECFVPSQEVAEHLAGAIRFATVSNADPNLVDWSQFDQFQQYLEQTYPKVHHVMKKEIVAGHNLIYVWKGTVPGRKPIAFLSHQDVVPVGNIEEWNDPPFSGIDDGENIRGRGSVDMKNQLIMVMEACERLIHQGYTPDEDVYLCFGQNEEVGDLPEGTGADRIAELLDERGISFDCVIDEGGAITSGSNFGIKPSIAVVGVGEKGFCDIRLESESSGGHSSRPPKYTSLGKVCRAAAKLEDNPCPPKLLPPVEEMMKRIAPHMKIWTFRFLVANLPLTRSLLLKVLCLRPLTRAAVSNTMALTQAEGSPQDNTLPSSPWIGINCRLLPGNNKDDLIKHIENVINDKDVKVSVTKYHQVHHISPTNTESFRTIERLVGYYYPGTITTPYLQFGGSDSRNYVRVCDNVYRFMPIRLGGDTGKYGAHAPNEYVPKQDLGRGTAFFMDFIKEYKGEQ